MQINNNFSVDDIDRVREYHREVTRSMSEKKRNEYYRQKAQVFLAEAGIQITPYGKNKGAQL